MESEDEELGTLCFNCMEILVQPSNQTCDQCNNCKIKFERSLASFDILPLVPFSLGCETDTQEIDDLISDVDFLNLATDPPDTLVCESKGKRAKVYSPKSVNKNELKNFNPSTWFLDTRNIKAGFINVVPELELCRCSSCNSFVTNREKEIFKYENDGGCPFCRVSFKA
eukprot:snap_masked-scaffold_11-processed-gene-0.12-mRNA-1 protein AED:1.00 eAED:1.00 QI:0/0/0/0/1/1/2/0/168